jgi:hypothetical protein
MGALNSLTDKASQLLSKPLNNSSKHVIEPVIAGNTAKEGMQAIDKVMAGNTARAGMQAIAKPPLDQFIAGNTARNGMQGLDKPLINEVIAGNTARHGMQTLAQPAVPSIVAGNTARHGLGDMFARLFNPSGTRQGAEKVALMAVPWWKRPLVAVSNLFQRLPF